MLTTILLAVFLSSIVSLVGAYALAQKSHWSQPFSLHLTALSSGVLLSTALLHLAPEAIEEISDPTVAMLWIFAGIVVFFLLERLVLWYHHHHDSHSQDKPTAWLIIMGDTVHNFVDGVTIAAAVMTDPALGLITMIAVGAHEIPQEIADFAVMVNGGMSRAKALKLNLLSALAALIGALFTYTIRGVIEPYIPWLIAFSAGMFLYISLSDLIPELHTHRVTGREQWTQVFWFFGGIIALFWIIQLVPELHG